MIGRALTIGLGLSPTVSFSFHARQRLRNSSKQRLDIMSELCTRLHEDRSRSLCLFLSLGRRNFPFAVSKICLIPYQHYNYVVPPFASDIVNPLLRLLECLH